MPTLTLSVADSRANHPCDFVDSYDYLLQVRPDVAEDEDAAVPLAVWWDLPPRDISEWWRSLGAAQPRDLAHRLGVRAAAWAVRRVLPLLREEEREESERMVDTVTDWSTGKEIDETQMVALYSRAEDAAETAYFAAGAKAGQLSYVPASAAVKYLVAAMAAAEGRAPYRVGHMLADVARLVAEAKGDAACARMMMASVIAQAEAMDHYRAAVTAEREHQRRNLLDLLRLAQDAE